ncbi:MAG TPA: thioredoxin-dependent thiol peroxidase [Spirochaetales bacterium]|nr:thioredoxin-dependent thiol peroxidase [Spirochaetales bacterium]HOT59620.1 thioredoxin-dependent thiol peroxidase [Spirochaetales bacterium]HPD79418.1 thioredoxin-dependent thiol peroxidase [Spirochaetales bacterium]HQG40121.1 thioredoxin-dependent thiol peroxidase [Spirochaetales bacterium]HQK35062.1 thioredoxin-dependent thiol peroxidase [Spirochaetales bacterium]
MMLNIGEKAPEFSLPDSDGNIVTLSQFKGKTVILYFYPKDDTPGCTKEACSFRDNYDRFLEKGAVVIGISKDKPASHAKFRAKYQLPFYLLSDESTDILQAYGAWDKKSLYGKSFFGIIRSTYVIGPDGRIVKFYPKVKPEGHAEEILSLLS